jgi:hypothetical protein
MGILEKELRYGKGNKANTARNGEIAPEPVSLSLYL